MPISLAPVRYRQILNPQSGPIAELQIARGPITEASTGWHASTRLIHFLRPDWVPKRAIYANIDGSGSHEHKNIACHIAISEALERWAYFEMSRSKASTKYGFDRECNTTGMSAYPGLIATSARQSAKQEAVERWALSEWWCGNLPVELTRGSSRNSGEAIIVTPFPEIIVMIVWRSHQLDDSKETFFSYGFAGGRSQQEAKHRALIEEHRNREVLRAFLALDKSAGNSTDFYLEKRLLYFASEQGQDAFQSRIAQTSHLRLRAEKPQSIVDSQIKGPWSQFAYVWRVLYENTSDQHLDPSDSNFFYF